MSETRISTLSSGLLTTLIYVFQEGDGLRAFEGAVSRGTYPGPHPLRTLRSAHVGGCGTPISEF